MATTTVMCTYECIQHAEAKLYYFGGVYGELLYRTTVLKISYSSEWVLHHNSTVHLDTEQRPYNRANDSIFWIRTVMRWTQHVHTS